LHPEARVGATNALLLPIPELTEMADGPDAISDLANAVEDYVYDRVLPSGVVRYPTHHWGAGTSFPTTVNGVKVGDTYHHTGLACLMAYQGPGWVQVNASTVANKAARDAMSTNYSSLLHGGFRVYQTDKKITWARADTSWLLVSMPPGTELVDADASSIILTGDSPWTVTGRRIHHIGDGWVLAVAIVSHGAGFTVNATGNVGNTRIAQLAAGWLPQSGYTPAHSMGTGRLAAGYVNSAGEFVLASMAPGANIAANTETLELACQYKVADPSVLV
jgi:hypothetical protein